MRGVYANGYLIRFFSSLNFATDTDISHAVQQEAWAGSRACRSQSFAFAQRSHFSSGAWALYLFILETKGAAATPELCVANYAQPVERQGFEFC